MNNDDVPEGFDFEGLAKDLEMDTFHEQANRIREMARIASEAAAGAEADAIQAGLDKRTARSVALCVLACASGGVIALV